MDKPMKRYWPKWWWRYPFCTGMFSSKVPVDYDPFENADQGLFASMKPSGGSPPPALATLSAERERDGG